MEVSQCLPNFLLSLFLFKKLFDLDASKEFRGLIAVLGQQDSHNLIWKVGRVVLNEKWKEEHKSFFLFRDSGSFDIGESFSFLVLDLDELQNRLCPKFSSDLRNAWQNWEPCPEQLVFVFRIFKVGLQDFIKACNAQERIFGVGDSAHNHRMDDRAVTLTELKRLSLEIGRDRVDINLHALSKSASHWKSHDVWLGLQAEGPLVCIIWMMRKTASSDSDILALPKIAEFLIQNLAEPELIAIIHHSYLARIVVYFEHLSDFHLQVELVILSIVSLFAELSHIFKFRDIFLT